MHCCLAYQRERLQFRADGTAKVKGLAAASANSHILFSEDEEASTEGIGFEESSNTPTNNSGDPKVMREVREAFLKEMRSKMDAVQQADKVSSCKIKNRSFYFHISESIEMRGGLCR